MTPVNRMRQYVDELHNSHNLEDLYLKTAEWTLELIDEYQYKPMPVKPAEVSAHEEIPLEERETLNSAYYDHHPAIRNYYELVHKVKLHNKNIYDWLKLCRGILCVHGRDVTVLDSKLKEVLVDHLWEI